MASFIGIDLGTTFSAVATIDETGRPLIVHNSDGKNLTPSCVMEGENGGFTVGEFARKHWGKQPDEAAARFKRDMGTSIKHTINGKEFTPTQLSTIVLKKLIADTRKTVGDVAEAVVTIPANFRHEARDATMSAALAAGLNVRFIINEPTAAALYYAFKRGEDLSGDYAVYDMGGGTFDISLIRVDGQDVEVLATNGVQKLGGDDFDAVLQQIVQQKFEELTGDKLEECDFRKGDAEEEKESLSKRERVTTESINGQIIKLHRDEFEEAISSLVTQAEMLCEATIEAAEIKLSDIRGVFLAGGSTRVPLVQKSVQRVFGQEPISSVNVDEVVALGAALYAAYKGERSELSVVQRNAIEKIKVSESTSKCFGTISLGMDAAGELSKLTNNILIRKGEKIPCSVTKPFYTVHEGQEGVDCKVTESAEPETDPRFVNVIWEGKLALPSGRPAGQEIKVTFAYDENQIMKCSFVDVATGRETKIDLSMASAKDSVSDEIEKFVVE